MTNDTSTLNGALLEMKDQLIYELGEKGVSASYDPSTGLLGLIARISDIQTGGSCYHIEFDEDSYEATGGSATISCTLQADYAPLSGATVTFTGSDSSVYTGITNSNGVATVTVSVSATTTFTATYSNVSDTCTVTVPGPAYSLAFSQDTYVCDFFSGVTVSCTLKNGNTPMSGETITFSYESIGGTESVTATTNSSGVATATVHFTSDGTLTATSNGVSDTCSIILLTYLFYDACNSSAGLTNYGASQVARGSTATITMEYDSTENAYKVYGSGNYHAFVPITPLDGQDNYTISMDCKGQAIRYNLVGFFLDNSADTTSYGLCFGLDIGKANNGTNQSLYSRLYRPNSDGTGYITYLDSNVLTADKYYNLRFTVNDTTLTGALYDGTTKLAEKTVTYTINNKSMGIFLYCEKGTTQSACYVKNIKAEAL